MRGLAEKEGSSSTLPKDVSIESTVGCDSVNTALGGLAAEREPDAS